MVLAAAGTPGPAPAPMGAARTAGMANRDGTAPATVASRAGVRKAAARGVGGERAGSNPWAREGYRPAHGRRAPDPPAARRRRAGPLPRGLAAGCDPRRTRRRHARAHR